MSNCHVANQISQYCNSPEEAECEVCESSMTEVAERGHGLLICDSCGHKVWADGEEYEDTKLISMGVLTMSITKVGEAHLNGRLDYAKEVLELLGEYDSKTVIIALKKDVKRFERMLKEVKGDE